MKPSELFKKDREIIRKMPPKEKLLHIWHYYKWYFAAALLVVIYIVSTISAYMETSGCVLNGYFLNVTGPAYTLTELSEEFHPGDGDETVYIDTLFFTASPSKEDAADVYETFQNLIARAHAGDLDFIVTGEEAVNQLIYNEFYVDLSAYLTAEQLSAYEGRLLYMDRAFLERIRQLDPSSLSAPVKYPDASDPSSMEDPVPVLIDIRDCQWISRLYPNNTGLHAFGLVTNGQHHEKALAFLDFLLKGTT